MAKTYDSIATVTLGSAAAGITFSGISSTYTDLELVLTGTTASSTDLRMQLNGITSGSYGTRNWRGTGASVTGQDNRSNTSIFLTSGTAVGSTYPFLCKVSLIQSSNTNVYRHMLITFAGDTNGSGTTQKNLGAANITDAISSLYLFTANGSNFQTGTKATLFGIKAA